MGTKTEIEWADNTLNFWKGCTKVDECCDNCYMYRQAKQYGWDATKVARCSEQIWQQPQARYKDKEYKWRSSEKVFVCSWSDFFHKDADQWREAAWAVIRERPDLHWIIVTKRIERVENCIPYGFGKDDYPNIMFMPTCGTQALADERIPIAQKLKEVYPWVKIGVSVEPMLGKMDLMKYLLPRPVVGCAFADPEDLCCTHENNMTPECHNNSCPLIPDVIPPMPELDLVIIGAESGPNRRPCKIEWVRDLVEQCQAADIPLFLKQLDRDGKVVKDINKFPVDLRIRQWPK